MFSDDDLWDRVRVGSIVDFSAYAVDERLLDQDQAIVRQVYLQDEIIGEVLSWEEEARHATIAELLQFLTGAKVRYGDLKKGNHIKPLDPKTRWCEFKMRASPQTRVFGAFVREDMFIGVKACLRRSVPDDCQDLLTELWVRLWGNDISRLPIDDPSVLLSNHSTLE